MSALLDSTSQRPDPSAAALRLPTVGVGSSLSARARLQHTDAAAPTAAANGAHLPPITPQRHGSSRGAAAAPLAPPESKSARGERPSDTREGAGALPIGSWLFRSPRPAGGARHAPRPPPPPPPQPPPRSRRRRRRRRRRTHAALRRDDDHSRRILASLTDGGRPAASVKPPPFVAPTRHEYTFDPLAGAAAASAAGAGGRGARGAAAHSRQEAIVRRRLGIID